MNTSQVKEQTKSLYTHLAINPSHDEIIVDSPIDFERELRDDFNCYAESCEVSDIKINEDEGTVEIGGKRHSLTPYGFFSLCKTLDIPPNFASKIPSFIFQTLLDDFKLIANQNIDFYIRSGESNNILNVVSSSKSKVEYLKEFTDFLREIDSDPRQKFKLSRAIISETGFRIDYLPTAEDNNKSVIKIGNQEYKVGRAITGDIYNIGNSIEINSLLYREIDQSSIMIGKYKMRKHGLNNLHDIARFKLNSTTLAGNDKKGTQPFKDAIREAWSSYSYSRIADFETMLRHSFDHDISLWKFFQLRSKLAKYILSSSQVDELIGTMSWKPQEKPLEASRVDISIKTPQSNDKKTVALELNEPVKESKKPKKEQTALDILKQMKKNISNKTKPSELDKILKTTILEGLNAQVIFNSITNYMCNVGLDEYRGLSPIAAALLTDTYNYSETLS